MSKIKKCPFCGRCAELRHDKEGFSYVLCANDGCYVRTDGHLNDESAIKAWNTRKPLGRIVERLEEFNEGTFVRANGRANGKTLAYGYSKGIEKAVMIVKEEGGLHEHEADN